MIVFPNILAKWATEFAFYHNTVIWAIICLLLATLLSTAYGLLNFKTHAKAKYTAIKIAFIASIVAFCSFIVLFVNILNPYEAQKQIFSSLPYSNVRVVKKNYAAKKLQNLEIDYKVKNSNVTILKSKYIRPNAFDTNSNNNVGTAFVAVDNYLYQHHIEQNATNLKVKVTMNYTVATFRSSAGMQKVIAYTTSPETVLVNPRE